MHSLGNNFERVSANMLVVQLHEVEKPLLIADCGGILYVVVEPGVVGVGDLVDSYFRAPPLNILGELVEIGGFGDASVPHAEHPTQVLQKCALFHGGLNRMQKRKLVESVYEELLERGWLFCRGR